MSQDPLSVTFKSPRIYNDDIINNIAVNKNKKKFVIQTFPSMNGAEITLTDENHTMGNLIRKFLLEDNRVEFAGYRMPHPLENRMIIKLKLKSNVKDSPTEVFISIVDKVKSHLKELQSELEEAFAA